MKLVHNNILIVMLMLIAFIGQSMASTAMPCTHESMNADMSMMNHANMVDTPMLHTDMMSVNEEQGNAQEATMDCCQEQCQCPMSGCVNLSFLLNTSFNSEIIAEQKILQSSSLQQSKINSSLYRPPIS